MKKYLPPLLALTLVISACAPTETPTSPTTPGGTGVDVTGNITPLPKGPKELDGIRVPNAAGGFSAPNVPLAERSLETAPAADAMSGGDAGSAAGFPAGAPTNATTDMADDALVPTEPTAQPTAAPTPAATSAPDSAEPDPVETTAPEVSTAQNFFYFSYDDSASTAGVEQTKFALTRSNPVLPNPAWVRPWEFLNYETFNSNNLQNTGTFQVAMGLWQHQVNNQNAYDLGVQVKTPTVTKAERQNVVLTLLLDVSGSMNMASVSLDESQDVPSLMEVAKAGLRALPQQLKAGDVVNLVTFSNTANARLTNWEYTGDDSEWQQQVNALRTEGGTNLNAGLEKAYELAQSAYSTTKTNRVMMLTDAFANAGTVNAEIIARNTEINDAEGIYFSGLGFGFNFNEAFLNTLTEAGKGSYTSIITPTDAERAFGERFIALTQIAARNVRFRLDYPASLQRTVSAAEQSSQVASEVDPIHFAANSSQYFLERFTADGEAAVSGDIQLTIDYTDPRTGETRQEVLGMNVSELFNKEISSIKDARMVTLLTQLIQGKVTAEEAQAEMDNLLQGHSSTLASEYQQLIKTWMALQPQDP